MAEDNGRIYFETGLDNKNLKKDASDAKSIIKGIADDTEKESKRMDNTWKNMAAGLATFVSGIAIERFVSKMVTIRGEIQQLETSFKVLLGSREKADKMLADMKQFAVTTPMELSDIAKAGQTMLGFGIEAENVLPILKQIGDVSMGDAGKFQSLTLAFSQMSATGRLMGQDLLQMINAGFNPLQVIAENTGKTLAELKKEMEKGAISVEMVEDAFRSATSEGGKFYGMLEQQGEGIRGLQAQLSDALTTEFNALGEANEKYITGAIKGATYLVENYKEIGKILLELIAVAGVMKAALVAETTVRTVLSGAITAEGIASNALVAIKTRLIALQNAYNKSVLANPYVLATAAIIGMTYAMYKLISAQTEEQKLQDRLNKASVEATTAYTNETKELDKLYGKLDSAKKGTKEYEEAKKAIMNKYGTQISQLQGENREVWDLSKAYGELKNQALAAAHARAIETYSQSAADTKNAKFNQAGGDLLKELQKGGDDRKAFKEYEQVMRLVSTGNKVPDAWLKQFDKSYGVSSAGAGDAGTAGSFNRVKVLVNQLKQAQSGFDTEITKLQATFYKAEDLLVTPPIEPITPKGGGGGGAGDGGKSADAAKKAQEQLEKEIKERKERIKRYEQEISEQIRATEIGISATNISLLEDGLEKELQQIDYNYDRLKDANTKNTADLVQKINEVRKLEWDNLNTGVEMPSFLFATENDLSDEEKAQIKTLANLAEDIKLKAITDAKKKSTDATKAKEKKELEDSVSYEIRKAGIIADAKAKAIENDKYEWEADRELAQLNNDLEEANKRLEQLGRQEMSPDLKLSIEAVKNEIEGINIEIGKIPEKKIKEVGAVFSELVGKLSGLDGEAGEFFGSIAKGIQDVSKIWSEFKTMTDSQKASSAVGAAVDIVNMLVSASKSRKDAMKAYYMDAIYLAHQYALALNEQLRLQGQLSGSVFVKNYSAEINSAFAASTEAVQKYDEAMSKLADGQAKAGKKNSVSWKAIGSGAVSGATIGAVAGGGVFSWLTTAIGAVGGAIVGLIGGLKKKDTYKPLLDLHKDLIDANGDLNSELAKQLIATNQLDDNTKVLVQNALDWNDANKEATDSIKDIVKELAGDLGGSLKDGLIDAWKAGEDAGERMFDALNKSLANLIENMIFGLVFSKSLKKFEDDLTKSLIDGGKGAAEIYKELSENLIKDNEIFKEQMDIAKSATGSVGFSPWSADTGESRTGMQKGIAGLTQDQGEELNGRFTAIQGHTYMIMNSMQTVTQNSSQSLVLLTSINFNTARLESIEKGMKATSEAVQSMNDRGVKML